MPESARLNAIARAEKFIDGGRFEADLAARVAVPTESQVPAQFEQLGRYQRDLMGPAFAALGFEHVTLDNPVPGRGPVLVANRIEDPALPTVLLYGHGDVVRSVAAEWDNGRDPYATKREGDRLYGRGVVDNKGQHTLAILALEAVLAERGRLGFNAKFMVETGEEQGSPGLDALLVQHREVFQADAFLGFDGPRKSFRRLDLNLGCRGGVFFSLVVDLARPGGLHSGHFGGVLPDAAIILAHALSTITTPKGRILVEDWLPKHVPNSVRAACHDIIADPVEGMPQPDPEWGFTELSEHEKVLAWTSFIVLAMSAGNPDNPVNAVPSYAKATCQIRHTVDVPAEVFVPALRKHLDAHGFQHVAIDTNIGRDQFLASRTDPENAWVQRFRRSIVATHGQEPNILPSSSGSNPSEMFKARLGVPVVWFPSSYAGCNQHGANEHGLISLFREGIASAAGIFWDLGQTA